MTVYKRRENEGSRDIFSPHFMEQEERKWKDYIINPMDKTIEFKILSHIRQAIVTKILANKAIKTKALSSIPIGRKKLNEIAYNKAFQYLREARY